MKVGHRISVSGAAQMLPGIRHTPPSASLQAAHAPHGGTGVLQAARCGPDLALMATRQVLQGAGQAADQVDLLCLALGFDNGPDWRLAPFRLAQASGMKQATVLGLQQMSNGGAAALAHAVNQLLCEPRATAAVVVAADSFTHLAADHWGSGSAQGVALEDGAAAVLLRPAAAGPLTIRSVATCGMPFVQRPAGAEDPVRAPSEVRLAVDDTVRRHLDHGAAVLRAVRTAITHALQDADLSPDDPSIARVMLPRLGPTLTRRLVPALPCALRPKADITKPPTAHLGPGDLLADLAELFAHPPHTVAPVTVLVSVGIGLTATCLVVERHTATEST